MLYFKNYVFKPSKKKKTNVLVRISIKKRERAGAFFCYHLFIVLVASLTCFVRITMFVPPSTNFPEANLQKKS